MIDKIDRGLVDWIRATLDQVNVSLSSPAEGETATTVKSLSPPAEGETPAGVNLYLMELVQSQPARTTRNAPLQMALRYLVTTQAATPEDAHQMLGKLVVAALENPEFEVEQEPVPLSVWAAFGIAPRPSFVIRKPFRPERPEKRAPLVKKPIVIKQLPLRSFGGQIVGPEDTPLVNVRVELPALELSTSTDSKGRFHFSALPAAPGPKLLRVQAKGQEFSIKTERAGTETDPLVIQLPLEG